MTQNKFSRKNKSNKIRKITRDFIWYTTWLSEALYDLLLEINNNRLTKFFMTPKRRGYTAILSNSWSAIFFRP